VLRNYFIIAVRNFRKHKLYSFINVFSLALSMSVCLLIIVLVRDQISYDQFHEKKDRIHRVIWERPGSGGQEGFATTPAFVGPDLERGFPFVEETVRLREASRNAIRDGKYLSISGLYAEPSFFDVFSFNLLSGNPDVVLAEPYSAVVTDEAAARIFGSHDPVGEIIALEGEGDFTVTGVVRTRGVKSHLSFDVLVSFSTLEAQSYPELSQPRGLGSFANYIVLQEPASADALEPYLAGITYTTYAPMRLALQPLTAIAFGPDLTSELAAKGLPPLTIAFLAALALLVMSAAAFNYVGLTIARSLQRAKEVGVRKTIGAHRRQILVQLLTESMLMALVAFLLAYALLGGLLQELNNLSLIQDFNVHILTESVYDPVLAGIFVAFSLVVGLLAGLYPALYLSGFNPASVIKGIGETVKSKSRLRKSLVVLQLSISLVLMISVVLVYRQFNYMVNFNYGFNPEGLVNVVLKDVAYPVLRNEVLRHPDVLDVSAAWGLPGLGTTGINFRFVGTPGDTLRIPSYSVDARFVENMGLHLLAGRNFFTAASDSQAGLILNESAVRRLGFPSPQEAIGKPIWMQNGPGVYRPVTGVIRDFQSRGLNELPEPLVLYQEPHRLRHASIRIRTEAREEALAHIETVWKRLDPIHPIEYAFYDEQLRQSKYNRTFSDMLRIIGLVAFIAFSIACLGLLSMAAFASQIRTKEIGVRKVFGASVPGLLWLLSREFVWLTAIAIVLATPIAWFGNNLWLEEFANRASFGVPLLAASTLIMLGLAVLAVGSQTLRAALADPVKSLRYE
jgi:putative ABC transport system permease protein